MAFAYQKPAVYVETNVRAVFLHELFPGREGVPDRELEPAVAAAAFRRLPPTRAGGTTGCSTTVRI